MEKAMKFLLAALSIMIIFAIYHYTNEPAALATTEKCHGDYMPAASKNNKANPEKEDVLAAMQVAEKNHGDVIRLASKKERVAVGLIKVIIALESRAKPWEVSKRGAEGLMQLMPVTQEFLGVEDPFDPVENILQGTRYLRYLLDHFHGDTGLAVAAYKSGIGHVSRLVKKGKDPTRDAYVQLAQEIIRAM